MNDKQKGTIKFKAERRFGFILPDGAQESDNGIFFHSTSVIDDKFDELTQGQRVEFDIEETEKGPRAAAVAAV